MRTLSISAIVLATSGAAAPAAFGQGSGAAVDPFIKAGFSRVRKTTRHLPARSATEPPVEWLHSEVKH